MTESNEPQKLGRPSKYKPEYAQKIIEYFDIPPSFTREIVTTGKNDYEKIETVDVPNELPHLIGFAREIGVHIDTINEWSNKHEDFSDALKEAKLLNERMLVSNALRNLYNSTFSIFMAKNKFGWRDEQHLDSTAKQEPLIIKIEGSDTPNSVKDVESQGNDS